jgi:cell division protease FtsH
LGLAAYKTDDEHPFLGYELAQGRDYSEATAALVDKNVQQILTERYEIVKALLTTHRAQLDRLVDSLLHNESLTQDELRVILGEREETAKPPQRAESFAPAPPISESPVSEPPVNHPNAS